MAATAVELGLSADSSASARSFELRASMLMQIYGGLKACGILRRQTRDAAQGAMRAMMMR